MKNKVSTETQHKAMKVAKGTKKVGQTKEQTKLIAQGIEKGIAEYKKQQSKKLREIDKQRKQKIKQQQKMTNETVEKPLSHSSSSVLPWFLLVLSWLAFVGYIQFML